MMLEKKMTDFLEVLSSKEPVPGGGGASAAVGAFAAALGMMVANLTVGKKTYAAVEEEILGVRERLEKIRDQLWCLPTGTPRLSSLFPKPMACRKKQKNRKQKKNVLWRTLFMRPA